MENIEDYTIDYIIKFINNSSRGYINKNIDDKLKALTFMNRIENSDIIINENQRAKLLHLNIKLTENG